MKILAHLSQNQLKQIDDLIEQTILPALQEDVCIPNMDDVPKSDPNWDSFFEDRAAILYVEALTYLKNNLV